MKRMISLALILGIGITLSAPAEEASLKELDGLVGRWIGLRTTMAQEERSWAARQDQWLAEINLLEQESKALDQQMATFGETASSEEQAQAQLLKHKQAMRAELGRLAPVLDRAERELITWETRLPKSLRLPLAPLFKALPKTSADAEKREVTHRVQTLVSLFTQIENLQHGFHTTREMVEIEAGTRRQVDVLYVGLARAFAVSLGDDWAAVGTPGDHEWHWQAQPEHAAAVRNAINLLKRQKAAELVHLPMQLTGAVK